MNQSTYPLAAMMINQFNRLDMVSNNLANTNTVGFKQEGLSEGSFNYYLERMEKEKKVPNKFSEVANTIPKIDKKFTDAKLGPFVVTGNELDFALKIEDTFFKIKDKNGETVLTRDGSFSVLNGILVNKNGNEVLDNDNNPIVAEDNYATLIGVVKTDFNNLRKIGDNNYKIIDTEQVDAILENDEYVKQGAIEKSNVNAVHAMVQLIEAHRQMGTAQKAIEAKGELSKSLIDKIGKEG